jgi:hypothetical protein
VLPRGSKGEGERQRAVALTPLRCSCSGCSTAGSSGAVARRAPEVRRQWRRQRVAALGFHGRRRQLPLRAAKARVGALNRAAAAPGCAGPRRRTGEVTPGRSRLWQNQPKLYRLKYASPFLRAPTCLKRYNPLACRVTSR